MATKRITEQRQAVVLIHGMGEQHPLDTIRAFLRGTHPPGSRFFSWPQRLGGNTELRRFSRRHPETEFKTDYFEFYWAHHLQAGSARYALVWALKNAFRTPPEKEDRALLRSLNILRALLIVFLLLAVAIGGCLWLIYRNPDSITGWQLAASIILTVAALALTALLLLAWKFLAGQLADAARYLTPDPANIEARNAIRNEGLELLRHIHASGVYNRVIVVGHSLGSVIGFDILRLAWDELRHPEAPSVVPGTMAREFTGFALELPANPTPEEIGVWQQTQHALWVESRRRTMRWLVTDFITLGSPLAHASFLLDDDPEQFRERLLEREYPTSPPDVDTTATGEIRDIFYTEQYEADGVVFESLVAHHGAMFAVTRWTNGYFPVKGLTGDPIGGPIAEEFGRGIRDVAIRLTSDNTKLLQDLIVWPHLKYWAAELDPARHSTDPEVLAQRRRCDLETGTRVAHEALREFLRLDQVPPDPEVAVDVTAPFA